VRVPASRLGESHPQSDVGLDEGRKEPHRLPEIAVRVPALSAAQARLAELALEQLDRRERFLPGRTDGLVGGSVVERLEGAARERSSASASWPAGERPHSKLLEGREGEGAAISLQAARQVLRHRHRLDG